MSSGPVHSALQHAEPPRPKPTMANSLIRARSSRSCDGVPDAGHAVRVPSPDTALSCLRRSLLSSRSHTRLRRRFGDRAGRRKMSAAFGWGADSGYVGPLQANRVRKPAMSREHRGRPDARGRLERAPPRFWHDATHRSRRVGSARATTTGALQVLRRAVELGVDLIDTADSYGPNVAEELISRGAPPVSSDV